MSVAGKITIFIILVLLALVKVIQISIILELKEIKKHFIWKITILNSNKTPIVKIMKMTVEKTLIDITYKIK